MANFLTNLNRKVGLDLGTARTRIWLEDEGVLVDEPSLIAVNTQANKVIAVGQQAEQMLGKVGRPVQVLPLLDKGNVVDDELVQAFLKILLQKAVAKSYFFSPEMMVSLPNTVTSVKRKILVQVLYKIGAKDVYTISQTLAAAIGAGVPIADASACFLMQLGAGVASVAAISLGKIVEVSSSRQAGWHLLERIQYWFKQHHQLDVSQEIASHVLKRTASLNPDKSYKTEAKGISLSQRKPQEVQVSSQDFQFLFEDQATVFADLTKKVLKQAPADLTIDVIDKGLLLSGGLAQLDGLDLFLSQYLEVPVSVVEEPELTVIKGIGAVLEHLDQFKQSLAYETASGGIYGS